MVEGVLVCRSGAAIEKAKFAIRVQVKTRFI